MRRNTTMGEKHGRWERACMRIVLQQVGICFAHVILKSVVSGWLWDRWECFLRRKRGRESILQHLECFCNGCGGWESFLQLWFPTHKPKIFASPPWESLCKTLESISGTTVKTRRKHQNECRKWKCVWLSQGITWSEKYKGRKEGRTQAEQKRRKQEKVKVVQCQQKHVWLDKEHHQHTQSQFPSHW